MPDFPPDSHHSRGTSFCRGVCGSPLVRLNPPLARLEEATQNLVYHFHVGILTSRVWPLNSNQVPCEDVHPQLVPQGGLPRILVGRKGIPLLRDSILGDAKVRPISTYGAVIAHIVRAQPALKDNLRLRGRWRQGCEEVIGMVLAGSISQLKWRAESQSLE
jgi:hypothetical protein